MSLGPQKLCAGRKDSESLFSAGLNGEIIEYDLQALTIKYAVDALEGPSEHGHGPSGSQLLVSTQLLVIQTEISSCAHLHLLPPVFIGSKLCCGQSQFQSEPTQQPSNQLYLDSNRRYTIGVTGDVKIPCPFAPFLLLLWILFVH